MSQLASAPTPSAATAEAGPRTIPALWARARERAPDGTAYLVEDAPGQWRPVTWGAAVEAVDELANGLLALGIRKGEKFPILAATSLEWAQFDFALALVGAVGAPIYPVSSQKDVEYILDHSDAVGVLVENEAQRAKVEAFAGRSDRLRHVLSFADLDDLRARGRAFREENPGALAAASAAIAEDDLFTLIYTSGTTGPPKGCMIRHRNYFAMAASSEAVNEFLVTDDVMLLYLPLAHNFGRLMHLLGPFMGFSIAFVSDPLRVAEALPHVRPTVLPSVPRVFEKVHTAVLAQFDAATGMKRKIVDWALVVGRQASSHRQRGEQLPRPLARKHKLADRLVYSKVKEKLGGRLRVGISGGAPLAQEIAEFFHALDILILEGYGLTECTTASNVNRPSSFRFGTVGPAMPGIELKLADDGEVLIRGDTLFAGYYKDAEATAEVLGADGWLRSGDIGELDEDGFLKITDRKKDILVTAGGKNVAPQNLENDLKTSRFVSQALVVGDRRPYVAALVTLDEAEIGAWAAEEGLPTDVAELARHERTRALVQEVVESVNSDRSRFEQIKRFTILPRDFSMDEGEITPTLKLKRRTCLEHFAREVEELYS